MKRSDPVTKYTAWIQIQVAGKPLKARSFLHTAYYGGVSALVELAGIPAGKLSLAPYIDPEYEDLYRMYESLIRTAVKKPDQFIHRFCQELDKISRYIRENSLYTRFSGLSSRLCAIRSDSLAGGDSAAADLTVAYGELMQQTYYFLTPSEYDLAHLLCGYSTDGEPLYCGRYCPELREIQELTYDDAMKLRADGQPIDMDALTKKYAAEYGCRGIKTNDGLFRARNCDDLRAGQMLNLLQYINEYTYDMVPDVKYIYTADTAPLEALETRDLDLDGITDSLAARSRTLPANGIRYDLSYSSRIPDENRLQALYLKDICREDRIVVLFKLRFRGQDLCGYYDRKDQVFYLQLNLPDPGKDRETTDKAESVVLYLYAAAVTPDGGRMVRDFGEHFRVFVRSKGKSRYPVSVTAHPLGGELRNTYEDRGEPPETAEEPPGDGGDGQKKRTLQGYIRKLAPGDLPSEEDKARAKELGFALAEDEVYEEPFL